MVKFEEKIFMDYILIETEEQFQAFYDDHQDVSWMGFDTEFVGEKRYYTLLCLIQVISAKGVYLIDLMKLKNIDLFLQLIENEDIVKITHAGENDYRVLNMLYGTVPKNLFDTQLAVGFLSHVYPMSFQKLVERELEIRLPKGFMVTDWEARPFSQKQLKYAVNDVIYLPELWKSLTNQLVQLGRLEWAHEEMNKWEDPNYYVIDPYREALNNNIMPHLTSREQVFMLRLFVWRRTEAEAKNYSKEMILPVKLIPIFVRNINEGKTALMQNRLIPDRLLHNNWDRFNAMFQDKMTEQEREILKDIPMNSEESQDQAFTTELLHLFAKQKCINNNIAPSLLINKAALKDSPENKEIIENVLSHGWRRALLGDDLYQWIEKHGTINFEMNGNQCMLEMK